jgi:hypothetical protein
MFCFLTFLVFPSLQSSFLNLLFLYFVPSFGCFFHFLIHFIVSVLPSSFLSSSLVSSCFFHFSYTSFSFMLLSAFFLHLSFLSLFLAFFPRNRHWPNIEPGCVTRYYSTYRHTMMCHSLLQDVPHVTTVRIDTPGRVTRYYSTYRHTRTCHTLLQDVPHVTTVHIDTLAITSFRCFYSCGLSGTSGQILAPTP